MLVDAALALHDAGYTMVETARAAPMCVDAAMALHDAGYGLVQAPGNAAKKSHEGYLKVGPAADTQSVGASDVGYVNLECPVKDERPDPASYVNVEPSNASPQSPQSFDLAAGMSFQHIYK